MNKEAILGLVRHVLTFGAGVLVSNGVLDAGDVEVVVGAVVALGGVAWSVWQKRQPS